MVSLWFEPGGVFADVLVQANLPYVIWIAAFNTSFLLAYLLIHTWALTTYKRSSAPAIFEAINRNGLVVFLVVRPSLPSSPRD